MPTPAEHYIEAERCLNAANVATDMSEIMSWYAEAKVHAILAATLIDTYHEACYISSNAQADQ